MKLAEAAVKKIITVRKETYFFVIKLVIGLSLAIFLYHYTKSKDIIHAVFTADLYILAIPTIMTLLNLYLRFIKWKIICNELLDEYNKKNIIGSLFIGFSANIITPFSLGEYVGRAVSFKHKNIYDVAAATFIDKVILLLIVVFVGSISTFYVLHLYYQISSYIIYSLFIVYFILFYIIWTLFSKRTLININSGVFMRKIKPVSKFLLSLNNFNKLKDGVYLKLALVSFLFYLCFITQFGFLTAAFSHKYDLPSYMNVGGVVMFVKSVFPPIALGDLGVREGASILLLDLVGISAEAALNASIFLFVLNVLTPALVGIFFLYRKG